MERIWSGGEGGLLLTSPGSSARLTCEHSVPDFNLHHQPMPEGGREAEDEVAVLPRHRDGPPEIPERAGGQNPAEGGPDLQPQENSSAPDGGVHRGSLQRQQDGERECMKPEKLPHTGNTGTEILMTRGTGIFTDTDVILTGGLNRSSSFLSVTRLGL